MITSWAHSKHVRMLSSIRHASLRALRWWGLLVVAAAVAVAVASSAVAVAVALFVVPCRQLRLRPHVVRVGR